MIDRKLLVAVPTSCSRIVPIPGRYVFLWFLTTIAMGSVWEDIWLEKPADSYAPANPQPFLVASGWVAEASPRSSSSLLFLQLALR